MIEMRIEIRHNAELDWNVKISRGSSEIGAERDLAGILHRKISRALTKYGLHAYEYESTQPKIL